MSRLGWLLLGAGITAFLVLRGKQLVHRFTPKGVQEQVAQKGREAAVSFGEMLGTFRVAMAQREAELREELSLTTQSND